MAMNMRAAAVSPGQVKLGTDRAPLWMWIPENDSKCMIEFFGIPFEVAAKSRADEQIEPRAQQLRWASVNSLAE
jgi:hypothetical protein